LSTPEQIARYAKLPLNVEVELGRCAMPMHKILSLTPGSLIKLSSPVGSKVDLLVGGVPFGSGEMARIGGALMVRITGFKKPAGE
jgi:flagellar motor switch/type III secretory pathway protein FliN